MIGTCNIGGKRLSIVDRKNNKETNVKKIKLKKKSYTLKVGKTARIKVNLSA